MAPYFLPYKGGQERFIYNLSKHLVGLGHEVDVITSNYPEAPREEVIDGIHVTRLNCLTRPLRNPFTPDMFREGTRIKKYDIVHTHNEHSFAAMAGLYYKKKLDMPLVLTCHGQLKFGDFFSDVIERIYSKTLGSVIIKNANNIVTLSQSDKSYLSALGADPEKIRIIPNAIDPASLGPSNAWAEGDEMDAAVRQKIAGKDVVLFTGPVIERKGVEYLIRAIPQVLKHVKDVVFVIVGNGDYLARARRMVDEMGLKDHVILTGPITDLQLISWYKSSQVFVLPSFSEGLPTSILEAMYFGLPVVSTSIPGIIDHFSKSALLVPPKKAFEMAGRIVEILRDRSAYSDLVKDNTRMVKRKYVWPVVIKEYEKIYQDISRSN
jgi:glycosyltransferase involved in cell wall biosynthesis